MAAASAMSSERGPSSKETCTRGQSPPRTFVRGPSMLSLMPDFLSPAEADHIRTLGDQQLALRGLTGNRRAVPIDHAVWGGDEILADVVQRVARLTLIPAHHNDTIMYKAHPDAPPPHLRPHPAPSAQRPTAPASPPAPSPSVHAATPRRARGPHHLAFRRRRGQVVGVNSGKTVRNAHHDLNKAPNRVATVLVYLTDVRMPDPTGHTLFPCFSAAGAATALPHAEGELCNTLRRGTLRGLRSLAGANNPRCWNKSAVLHIQRLCDAPGAAPHPPPRSDVEG